MHHSFDIQHNCNHHEWLLQVFNVKLKAKKPTVVRLPQAVKASEMRIVPEKWIGTNPELLVDVVGCC